MGFHATVIWDFPNEDIIVGGGAWNNKQTNEEQTKKAN